MSLKETNHNNFLLYTNDNGDVKVDVLLKGETIWLTINQMAELFGIDKSGISRHIKNIFTTGELQEELVVAKIATTTKHGAMAHKTQTKAVMYFNLDMVISVGYRVNSIRGTHFRIWATGQLKELIIHQEQKRQLTTEVKTAQTKYEEKLLQLEDLKKSLLQKAFAGELMQMSEP